MFKKLGDSFFGPGSAFLFGLAALMGWKIFHRKLTRSGAPAFRGLVLTLLVMMAVHITLGAKSYNGDVRYYILEVAALYLLALIGFLGPGPGRMVRTAVVALLLGTLITTQLYAYGALTSHQLAERSDDFGRREGQPPWRAIDPALEIWNHIEPTVAHWAGKPLILSYPTQSDFQGLMEPGRFFLISIESGVELDIVFPDPKLFVDWKTWHDREKDRFDFYLIGPLERAVPTLLPEIESEGYKEISKFTVTDDPASSPVTIMFINARSR